MTFRKQIPTNMARSFDTTQWALTTIDSTHRLAHEGFYFTFSEIVGNVTNSSSRNYLLRVAEDEFPHLRYLSWISSGGPVRDFIYESPTISNDGTDRTSEIFNRNRSSDLEPLSMLFSGPTVSNVGTLISTSLVPSAGSAGALTAGIRGDEPGEEWILKPDTDYLIRCTNNSGSAVSLNLQIGWYELNGYGN